MQVTLSNSKHPVWISGTLVMRTPFLGRSCKHKHTLLKPTVRFLLRWSVSIWSLGPVCRKSKVESDAARVWCLCTPLRQIYWMNFLPVSPMVVLQPGLFGYRRSVRVVRSRLIPVWGQPGTQLSPQTFDALWGGLAFYLALQKICFLSSFFFFLNQLRVCTCCFDLFQPFNDFLNKSEPRFWVVMRCDPW